MTARRTARRGDSTYLLLSLPLLFALAGSCTRASASSLAAGAGYDYQSGPGSVTWSGPLGFATTVFGESDATIALSRFHGSEVGWGWSGTANAGIALGSRMGGRVVASRSIGDGDYRGWQAQVGPTVRFGQERSLFLYGTHFEDNTGARLNQMGAEGSAPLGPQFTGLAGGAFGSRQGGDTNAQGTVGLVWSRWKGLLLIGQTTFGKNIAASSPSGTGGGAAVGPLGMKGRDHSTRSTTDGTGSLEAMALVGIRVVLP
jgi:hypothetical protein